MPTYPQPDGDQEPETRCVHCPRLLHHDELDRWACRVCEDRAREHITQLPVLYRDLHTKLAPATGAADNAGHVTGATRAAPLPVNLAALDLVGPGGIVTKLQTVEDDWRKTLGWTVAPWRGSAQQTLAVVVPFLLNNVGWACSRYEDVAEDLRLIGTLHTRADTVVNGAKEAKVPIGCCPVVTGDGVACAEKLKVSPWATEIRCPGCGTRWARDEWLRLGAVIRGLPMPLVA